MLNVYKHSVTMYCTKEPVAQLAFDINSKIWSSHEACAFAFCYKPGVVSAVCNAVKENSVSMHTMVEIIGFHVRKIVCMFGISKLLLLNT